MAACMFVVINFDVYYTAEVVEHSKSKRNLVRFCLALCSSHGMLLSCSTSSALGFYERLDPGPQRGRGREAALVTSQPPPLPPPSK